MTGIMQPQPRSQLQHRRPQQQQHEQQQHEQQQPRQLLDMATHARIERFDTIAGQQYLNELLHAYTTRVCNVRYLISEEPSAIRSPMHNGETEGERAYRTATRLLQQALQQLQREGDIVSNLLADRMDEEEEQDDLGKVKVEGAEEENEDDAGKVKVEGAKDVRYCQA